MILAVDVGNTQTVLGLIEGGSIREHWRIATDATLTADELRVKVGALLAAEGLGWERVSRIVLSSCLLYTSPSPRD